MRRLQTYTSRRCLSREESHYEVTVIKVHHLCDPTILALLGGGIWAFSGDSSTASVTSFASKEAKSSSGTAPAAVPQQVLPESAPVPAEEALSQRVVEYHIDVQLVPDTETLKASETVTLDTPRSKASK